jgi:hypothetical protein
MNIELRTAVESKGNAFDKMFYNLTFNTFLKDNGEFEPKITLDVTPFKVAETGIEICTEKRAIVDLASADQNNISVLNSEIQTAIQKFLNAEINK